MCSPWYVWFVEMGYPRLDIRTFEDGEWALIEYYTSPGIPHLTKWNYVLTHIRNVPITKGFVEKYVKSLDLHRKEVWDAAEAKSKEAEERHAALENHAQDTANKAFEVIRKNEGLVERIAKNGLREIDPRVLQTHVPSHQFIGYKPPQL